MHCSIWLYQSSIEKLGRGKYSCSFSRSVSDEEKSFIILTPEGQRSRNPRLQFLQSDLQFDQVTYLIHIYIDEV